MAAASVGVAMPAIIEPNTIIISSKGIARVFKSSDLRGGLSSGLNSISAFLEFLYIVYIRYETQISAPGSRAPIKRSPTVTVFCENIPMLFWAL